jgi:ribosomal protein S12 methylthiotransferase
MPDSPLRVALVSLGCPKNLVDSEKMLASLAEGGVVVNAPLEDADVVVVNTCGFLSAAREESLTIIREALERKREGTLRRVVVAGCLVNRDAERLFELAPGIDAIVGVHDRESILSAVTGRQRVSLCGPFAGGPAASDAGRFRLTPSHTAYLRVSEGCSQKCSFCTIPAIRGPLRSKLPEEVLSEARELIADGAVELNVIGQDTTAYGSDMGPGSGAPTLASLLRDLDRLDGLRWIRLLYTYPRRFTDDLIDAIAECEHVLPYVDMPLQHISTDILKRMGRGVTRQDIERLLSRLRERIPDVVLRTTLIVGFPGETPEQFRELLDFVQDFRFDAMGVFAFSPEEGTPAEAMDDQVDEEVRSERVEELMLAQQEIAFAANEAKIGSPVEILVDGIDGEGYCLGRTRGQAPDVDSVCILTEPRESGRLIRATVVDWHEYDLVVEPT